MAEDFGTPLPPLEAPQKKGNTTLIIVIVVLVLLCCCCIVFGGLTLWFTGDSLVEWFSVQGLQFVHLI